MTYLQFHLGFVLPPLVALAVARPTDRDDTRRAWAGILLLAVVAVAYTAPWDNYLVATGVWWYGPGDVAARLGHMPVEEYLFVVLQSLITGLWVLRFPTDVPQTVAVTRRDRVLGVGLGAAVGAVGGGALLADDATFYLGAILAWAGPVLALQWGFGWPVLWRRRRTVALGVTAPTLYLAAVDRIAIQFGIWTLSDRYTTGLTVGGLPVEEGAFFLVTNLFLVQGIVLFLWVVERWR